MKYIKELSLFESKSFDLKSADMQADFDRLNKMMFDGELKPVELRIMRTKYKLGVMAYNDKHEIEYVAISNFYDITEQQYLDILAHEMIHVWMEQKGIKEKDHHGHKFLSKMEELNKKFPEFNIRKSEDAADYNVTGSDKTVEYGVVLFKEGSNYSIVVVNKSVIENEKAIEEFIAGIKKYALHKFKSLKISVYKSAHPDLPKFKIKRSLSLNSLELFVLAPELAEEIMQEQPVFEFDFK